VRPAIVRGLTPVCHHLRPRRRANPPVAGQREGGSWGYRLDSQRLFNRRQALGLPPSLVSHPPSCAFRFECFEARRLARCLEALVQLDLTLPLFGELCFALGRFRRDEGGGKTKANKDSSVMAGSACWFGPIAAV
jgi:hypothetical protein